MSRLLTCFLSIILLIACKAPTKPKEYGSLHVNAYWKYNNFVGNRPDAGSEARLFSLTDSTLEFKREADVRGDCRFDSIPAGKYLLVVESENTRDDAASFYRKLYSQKGLLSKISKIDLDRFFATEQLESLYLLDSLTNSSLQHYSGTRALALYDKYKDSAINVADRILDDIPFEFTVNTGILMSKYPKKIELKYISIEKNKTEDVVIDFGITYL